MIHLNQHDEFDLSFFVRGEKDMVLAIANKLYKGKTVASEDESSGLIQVTMIGVPGLEMAVMLIDRMHQNLACVEELGKMLRLGLIDPEGYSESLKSYL